MAPEKRRIRKREEYSSNGLEQLNSPITANNKYKVFHYTNMNKIFVFGFFFGLIRVYYEGEEGVLSGKPSV